MSGYYYLHENGSLIYKPSIAVESDPDYFKSPFVKKYWKLEETDRGNAWVIILEALALGANIDRVKELLAKWSMSFEDSIKMITRITPTDDMKKGLNIFIKEILGMENDEFWIKGHGVYEKDKPKKPPHGRPGVEA